jgi:hypothetical protein
MPRTESAKVVHLADPTSGGNSAIAEGEPYTVTVEITGSADLLFHRWNCEAVDEKSKVAKNSAAKKKDDVESYVYRTQEGLLALPANTCGSRSSTRRSSGRTRARRGRARWTSSRPAS